MNARWFFALSVVLLAAGCRTDPNVVLLERENKLLEDRIYELQDLLVRQQRQLAACQGNVVTAEGGAVTVVGPALSPPGGAARSESAPADRPVAPRLLERRGGAAPGPGGVPQDRPTPDVQLPGQSLPPGTLPERFRVRPDQVPLPGPAAPPDRGTSSGGGAPVTPTGWGRGAGSARAARITLGSQFTGGYDADGRPGDEGIMLSIEPRDAQGNLVAAAAPVSVVVLDPALQGEAARVARWDFTAEEIAAITQSTRLADGIHLAMTWPGNPPAHNQLRLFARYTTADGRKLQAETPIEVDVAGRQIGGPVPAPPAAQALELAPALPEAPAAPPVAQADEPTEEEEDAVDQRPPLRVSARPSAPPRRRPQWSPER